MVDTGTGQQGRILTPKSDETIMREAELLTLRNISDSLVALHQEMGSYRESVASMREDMAVIRERQQQHHEFRESLKEMSAEFRSSIRELGEQFRRDLDGIGERVDSLEDRNLKQDGAFTFATLLEKFGPWMATLVLGWWAFVRGQ